PTNPYVDLTGNNPLYEQCQALVDHGLEDFYNSLSALHTRGDVVMGPELSRNARLKGGNFHTQMTFGPGTSVVEFDSLVLTNDAELDLAGEDDSIVVLRVAGQFGVGADSAIRLISNGTGSGTLKPERVMIVLDGKHGTAVLGKRATLAGTIV